MTVISWLGCDLVTGSILEELPDLTPTGTVGALLGAYTSTAFRLPLGQGGHGAPPRNWEAATAPHRSLIVAVLAGQPVWAGIVLIRNGGTEATAELACVSPEGYLDRRYVGDHLWTGVDEASVIAAGLAGDADTEGIGLIIDAPPTGVLRDRTYLDQDDKTIYSALRELMGVQGGPEWTIGLSWTDATETAVATTLRVRPRIGQAAAIAPNAVFTSGSASAVLSSVGASEARYTYREDYSSGSGANHIVATSSGEGETRPQSVPARDEVALAGGSPRYEHRFSPSSSITDQATLDAHAAAALGFMGTGGRVLTITARADAYPVLGTDWHLGDDIGYDLTGHRHPDGIEGVARAIGWDLDTLAGTVSPILLTPGAEVIS